MTDVSIIIPTYNSAKTIEDRVKDIKSVMECSKWSWEILICDDASRDSTPLLAERLSKDFQQCRFFPSSANRGRGRNVSDGTRHCQGRMIGFMDSDLSTRATYLVPVLHAIESGYEVAEANRTYKIHVVDLPFIFHRLSAHLGYAFLVRRLLKIRGHDTETGFKFFKRESLETLLTMTSSVVWFWDTEVIANAHRSGFRVAEIPSLFTRTKGMGSTVRFVHDCWSQFTSLVHYAWKHRSQSFGKSCCQKKPLNLKIP